MLFTAIIKSLRRRKVGEYRLNLLVSAAFQRGVHSASASALDIELEKTNRRPGAAPGTKFEHWTEVGFPSF